MVAEDIMRRSFEGSTDSCMKKLLYSCSGCPTCKIDVNQAQETLTNRGNRATIILNPRYM